MSTLGDLCNSFKYFLNFSTLKSNFSKKCKGVVFEICGVIDQVDHEESEYEVKTGTGSSFRRHFGKKTQILGFSRANISVAMGVRRPIFGAVSYLWGLNMWGKFQGHSSRASYICQVSHVGILGVWAHAWGGSFPPAWSLCPKFFRRYRLRNTVYERGKFHFSDSFSFWDIKASISHLVHWHCRHWTSLTALRVTSLKSCR